MDLQPTLNPNRHSHHNHQSSKIPTTKKAGPTVVKEKVIKSEAPNLKTIDTVNRKKYGQQLLDDCQIEPITACCWNLFYGFVVLVLSVLFSTTVIFIPLHNAIEYPEYWWEILLPAAILNPLYLVLGTVLECQLIFRYDFFKSFRFFVWLYLSTCVSGLVLVCTTYLIWTNLLGYNSPMPFLGLLNYPLNVMHYITFWRLFPYELRNKKEVRKRIWTYMLYRLWFLFYSLEKFGLNVLFNNLPLQIQWIMAIIFPLVRELNLWVLSKLLEKSTDLTTTLILVPKLAATLAVNIVHSFFVAMIISTSSTPITSYCLLAADFFLNLYSSYEIVQRHRKIDPTISMEYEKSITKKKQQAQILFAIESVEFIVPIVYCITFVLAYYGPNATIIGNVRNNEWQYTAVEDLRFFVTELILMFFIEFASCIVSWIILWKFTSISFLQEGYKVLKVYWPYISICVAGRIFSVSLIIKYYKSNQIYPSIIFTVMKKA